jgi:hypothetical protein
VIGLVYTGVFLVFGCMDKVNAVEAVYQAVHFCQVVLILGGGPPGILNALDSVSAIRINNHFICAQREGRAQGGIYRKKNGI